MAPVQSAMTSRLPIGEVLSRPDAASTKSLRMALLFVSKSDNPRTLIVGVRVRAPQISTATQELSCPMFFLLYPMTLHQL